MQCIQYLKVATDPHLVPSSSPFLLPRIACFYSNFVIHMRHGSIASPVLGPLLAKFCAKMDTNTSLPPIGSCVCTSTLHRTHAPDGMSGGRLRCSGGSCMHNPQLNHPAPLARHCPCGAFCGTGDEVGFDAIMHGSRNIHCSAKGGFASEAKTKFCT